MRVALKAGCVYFAIVFAIGFAMGALRVLVTAPRLGETAALLAELPIMLGASWLVCGWILRRWRVGNSVAARAVMGGLAFALLMIAEAMLARFGFGRSLAVHLASYREPLALAGLAMQIVFAAIPLLRLARVAPRNDRV